MSKHQRPSPELVKEALRRIPKPQLRRAFYEGLTNPLWLEPLKEEGVFSVPPPRVVMKDGSTGDPYWPEIGYVVRVAGDAPRVAGDILLDLKERANAWVRRALFSIGATVPAIEAARLKPVLKSWVGSGFGWRTDQRQMVDFAINLLNGGEYKTGRWLANVLFRPAAKENSTKPDLILDEYWYEEGLPRVVTALGPTSLPLVLGWLVEHQRATGQLDGWSFIRPSIADRRRTGQRGVEDALIDATRDLSIDLIKTDPQGTIALLVGLDSILTRRISMHAAASALRSNTQETAASAEIAPAAAQLLFDPRSNDERCRVEFGELARELASYDPSMLDPLEAFIAAGPEAGTSNLRAQLRRDPDEDEAETVARVVEFSERWEHIWLASVGNSSLTAHLSARLAELDNQFGAIEDPLRPPLVFTSWSGPSSPLTQDDLAAMSPGELVDHLETWHDRGDGWGPEPSHEGQARELAGLVTAAPQALRGATRLTARLRPTYLRAILNGWSAAFKAGLELDWGQIAETTSEILMHSDELDFPREGGNLDDDPDFTWAKKAAVNLLADLLKKTESPRLPTSVLHDLANLLIELSSDESAWISYSEGDPGGGMDPLTISLNWQWPVHVRGLATLVSYGPTAPWSTRSRAALLAELNRPDPHGASRAVLGENLGRLINADEIWTQAHVREWFGDANDIDAGQQVALSTSIATHRYHWTLFTLLSPAMLAAIAIPGRIADGWHHHNSTPIQRIGQWVVEALIFGDTDWGNPVVTSFFESADAGDRGESLGHIAWEFMNATSVEQSIRDRFASVWDARIAHVESHEADAKELRRFYWIVLSERFDPEWWLPRLKRALELDTEMASERHMMGKMIAKAADIDPRAALEVTKLLVGSDDSMRMAEYDMPLNAIPVVIARARIAEEEQLNIEAISFMNDLGEAGHLELARQVQAVLEGSLTQRDVSD